MADSVPGVDSVAGVVLAAGAGTRLRPLTRLRPKALCPVGGVPLVDRAIGRLGGVVGAVAVNAHHGAEQVVDHLGCRHGADVHVEVEHPVALGTAGALANLRGWLDGRAALVVNADTVSAAPLSVLLAGWDGRRPRLLVVGAPELTPRSTVVGSLLPAASIAACAPEPSGLYEVCWRPAQLDGTLEVLGTEHAAHDCGTPRSYLAANMALSGGASVIGEGAVVEGELVRSVVWDGARVAAGERLVDAVRAEGLTVLVR